LEAAYGGISLLGIWPAPTGSVPVGAKNDTELSRRQCNLESFEEKIIFWDDRCALRQGFVADASSNLVAADASSVSAFPNDERIALG
jgi:hypothetical protein